MSYAGPRPRPMPVKPRHSLLFELIRQRSMAQDVAQRVARKKSCLRDDDPVDFHQFAQAACRSIAPDTAPLYPLTREIPWRSRISPNCRRATQAV